MTKFQIILAVIGAGLLFAVAHAQTEAQTATPAPARNVLTFPRYQLFQGEHYMVGIGTTDKTVLRIDTATGAVDEWIAGTDGNKNMVNRWVRTGGQ